MPNDEWQRHMVGAEEFRSPPARIAYRAALVQVLAQTDTRWAPWSMIDANDSNAAQVAGLTAIADLLGKALPQSPPETAGSVIPFMVPSERAQPSG